MLELLILLSSDIYIAVSISWYFWHDASIHLEPAAVWSYLYYLASYMYKMHILLYYGLLLINYGVTYLNSCYVAMDQKEKNYYGSQIYICALKNTNGIYIL